MIEALGASRDTPRRILHLEVVSLHSDVVNCADERKMRWTLIADAAEFQPRSILIRTLPALRRGERITVNAPDLPLLFDPRIVRGLRARARWHPLLREWADFICEPELKLLRRGAARSKFAELSGMGPGLTPAGDDFIAGWITAARCDAPASAREKVRSFYMKWQPERTTWFSRWMISDAVRGKIWKRGKDLLSALAGEEGEVLANAALAILNWGHTSGRAWLAGLAKGFIE